MGPIFVLIAGKRKSGKDYCAQKLAKMIEEKSGFRVGTEGVSFQLKRSYAELHPDVNFEELLTSGPYKEAFRKEMIEWGETVRDKDPGHFCRLVEETARSGGFDVFIIPDCRRPTDIEYFNRDTHKKVTLRVNASEETRIQRGWKFTGGVDDAASECALDDFECFEFTIDNSENDIGELLRPVFDRIISLLFQKQ